MLAVAETEAILLRAASWRVVVVGDLILDEYFWGEIERISPEAPVPVLRLRRGRVDEPGKDLSAPAHARAA